MCNIHVSKKSVGIQQALQQAYDGLRKAHATLQDTSAELSDQGDMLRKENDALKNEMMVLKESNGALAGHREELQQEVSVLQRERAAQEEKNASLLRERSTLEDDLDTVSCTCVGVRVCRGCGRSFSEALCRSVCMDWHTFCFFASCLSHHANTTQVRAEQERLKQEYQNHCARHAAVAGESETQNRELESQVKALNKQIRALQAEGLEQEQVLTAARTKHRAETTSLEHALSEMQSERDNLREEIISLKVAVHPLQDERAALERSLAASQAAHSGRTGTRFEAANVEELRSLEAMVQVCCA